MAMLKRLLRSPRVQLLIGVALGFYLRAVGATTRWTHVGRAHVERIWREGGGVIVCIWHGRILLVREGWAVGRGGQDPRILISRSPEGGVVAHVSRTLGAPVIRGSTAKGAKRKGGFEAMRAMLAHLSAGGAVCITPDGPRGPRMRASAGAVQLARLSGAPIVCMAWSVRPRALSGGWDRMVAPFPFGRGAYVWGAPMHVGREDDLEAARGALEAELNRLTAEADARTGHAPIAPAPAAPRDPAAPAAP